MTSVALICMVKLAPADRAVITGAGSVVSDVLQVTPEIVRLSSITGKMRLLAVTAVVFTCKVGFAPVGIATAPLAAEVHTAGDAPLAQFTAVR